jgi:predicted  nucleic acid-binding Zn-ribbon protein
MDDRLRANGRRAAKKLSELGPKGRVGRLERKLDEATRRITELEEEVQESRRLHRRLAELTDIVQELLVPLAQRDEDKVNEYLDKYAAGL